MKFTRTNRLCLTVFLLVLFFYDPMPEVSIGRHLLPAKALWESGDLYLDSVMDHPVTDVLLVDGHYYSGAVPGPTIMMIAVYPVYLLIHPLVPDFLRLADPDLYFLISFVGVFFLMASCLSLSAVVSYRLFQRFFDSGRALFLSLALCLGTPFLFYSQRVTEYPPLLLLELLFLSLFLCASRKDTPATNALLGLLAGSMWLFNPIGTVLSVLFFAVAKGRKVFPQGVPFIVGMLPALAVFGAFQWATYGSPLGSGYAPEVNKHSILHVYNSYLTSGQYGKLAKQLFTEIPVAAWHLLVGIRGIWVFAPITLLATWALVKKTDNKSTDMRACILGVRAAVAGNFAIVLLFIHGIWVGGPSWGPRYLLPCIPFLIVAVAFSANDIKRRALGMWTAVSIGMTWFGVQFGHATSPGEPFFYFYLMGPTTPFHRWLSYHSNETLIPQLLERSSPGPFAQYVAYNNVGATGAYLLLVAFLIFTWRNEICKTEVE